MRLTTDTRYEQRRILEKTLTIRCWLLHTHWESLRATTKSRDLFINGAGFQPALSTEFRLGDGGHGVPPSLGPSVQAHDAECSHQESLRNSLQGPPCHGPLNPSTRDSSGALLPFSRKFETFCIRLPTNFGIQIFFFFQRRVFVLLTYSQPWPPSVNVNDHIGQRYQLGACKGSPSTSAEFSVISSTKQLAWLGFVGRQHND